MNYMGFELGIWEIAVLALLREAPMHPYQMQKLLHLRHKDEILALKRGSLYHAIRRLLRAELIAEEATSREGNRPERTTYRIAPAGLDALLSNLRKIVSTPRRESSEFMAAMSFLIHLEPGEATRLLQHRASRLDAEIAHRTLAITAVPAHVAPIHLVESEYLLAMLRAELAWVRELEKGIQEGRFAWDVTTILREAAKGRQEANEEK
jgi:DNA-binding PadR family transcriptional regulator